MRGLEKTKPFWQTLTTFWTGKRFLLLTIFALVLGNITLYATNSVGQRQVRTSGVMNHGKVYNAFQQILDREKRSLPASDDVLADEANGNDGEKSASSAYWTALRETRRQFPQYRINLLIQGSLESDREKKIFDTLANRPKGWHLNDEDDGWLRSFFVLPTKNVTSLQIVSYVRDDLSEWQSVSLQLGVYAFVVLFLFGWFWSRATEGFETSAKSSTPLEPIHEKVLAVAEITETMGRLITEIQHSIEEADASTKRSISGMTALVEDSLSQIKLLAVNGSLEAARMGTSNARVFQVITQQINQLVEECRRQLQRCKELKLSEWDQIRERILEADRLIRLSVNEKDVSLELSEEPEIFPSSRGAR